MKGKLIYAIVLVATLFSIYNCIGQPVLIPYKKGELFGICDEKANIIIQPTYNNISYLKDYYFQYTNTFVATDTLKKMNGELVLRQIEKQNTGVYFKQHLIIANQPYKHFLIYKNCIVGSQNPYHPEKCALFNLKGKQIFNEAIKGMGIADTRDFGSFTCSTADFTLVAIYQLDEGKNQVVSIAVFNNKLQKITNWLVKKVYDFRLIKNETNAYQAACTYSDEMGVQKKYLVYTSSQYKIIENKQKHQFKEKFDTYNNNQIKEEISVVDVAVPTIESVPDEVFITNVMTDEEQERNGYIFYQLLHDTLYYVKQQGKVSINTSMADSLIFIYPKNTIQKNGIIYSTQNKFGLIAKGIVQPFLYDSLFYMADNYLACKIVHSKLQWGIIDKFGAVITPFIYDSIMPFFKKFSFEGIDTYQIKNVTFLIKDDHERFDNDVQVKNKFNHFVKNNATVFQVYSKNKCGLIHADNSIVLPLQYDIIAENGLSYGEKDKHQFYLIQKDGLYGVAFMHYQYNVNKMQVDSIIQPCFAFIPCYFKNNYYQQTGLQLFALFNQKYQFMGYANCKGLLYAAD